MRKSGVHKATAASRSRARRTPVAFTTTTRLPGLIPTPQIIRPANNTTTTAGSSITVHVSTNRPDLQTTVWLLDLNGNVIDKVAVTWPMQAPFTAQVVLTIPNPAVSSYLVEVEQANDVSGIDGGIFIHAIQISVM